MRQTVTCKAKWMFISFLLGSFLSLYLCGCSGSGSGDHASTDVGNPDDLPTAIAGAAQKGPFQQYTQIGVHEMDAQFNQTGIYFSTETHNDMGDFTFR